MEITIPAQRPWSAPGFWFASRDGAGAQVWAPRFDLGLSSDECPYAKVTVEQSEDRVYVVAANGQGDIYAFDRGTGSPLWQARNLDFYRHNQWDVGASVCSAPASLVGVPIV